MALNEYRFVTHWRLEAPREEVFAVLSDSKSLTRWWPSVYRRVHEITPPHGPGGVGKRALLHTQGWLPYRLRWELRCRRDAASNGARRRSRSRGGPRTSQVAPYISRTSFDSRSMTKNLFPPDTNRIYQSFGSQTGH